MVFLRFFLETGESKSRPCPVKSNKFNYERMSFSYYTKTIGSMILRVPFTMS